MLKQLQKSNSEGFTIIEVLIVLAIAGLIMLVVFLAVPALQRNSRNTTMKNDVQNVLGGVSEYQGANNGSMPTGISGTGTISYTGGTTTTATIEGTTKVVLKGTASATAIAAPTTVPGGEIDVIIGQTCGATPTLTTRAISAYYNIEATSGNVVTCQSS